MMGSEFWMIFRFCGPFSIYFYVHGKMKLDLNHSIFIPAGIPVSIYNLSNKTFQNSVTFFTDKFLALTFESHLGFSYPQKM